ncbi:MAG: glycoside hydrolase family 92 protein, partial [Clostridiales bacterium]|nr:glycoside hydrolase family 92 protein [Clostridiales bacterium]
FSELQIGTGEDGELLNSPMQTISSNGPSSVWVGTANTGWTGDKALKICGTHSGKEQGSSYNVLYKDVNIPVSSNTELSYVFFPAAMEKYDYDYTSMHMAVDLKFTDGTYLRNLKATDQYGNGLTPDEQGNCKFWNTMQWNLIRSSIGTVAAGKTIKDILIGYENLDPAAEDTAFLAYLDDIVIENAAEANYERLTDYVDIRRGSNSGGGSNFSRGLIQPLVTTPHGFNQYEPCTGDGSGNMQYRYQQGGANTTLKHISVNHFASNWLGEYGTWQFMANTSIDAAAVEAGSDINAAARAADFSHDNETAKAHLYSVTFDEGSKASGVTMEVTPTEHAAFTRFIFPADSENRNVILDCERAGGSLTLNEDGTFTAYSDHTNNGAKRMHVYGVFMNTPDSVKVVGTKQGILTFPAAGEGDTVITMKFATSFISADQAKKNLELEIAENETFDTVCAAAQKTWEDKLGVIEIEGATEEQMITFYSNMYRMFAYPMNYSENTGTKEAPVWKYASPYSGSNTAPVIKEGKMYTINGFWDTYRTTWAAYALLTPAMDAEVLDGLVEHYNDSGWLPRWITPGATNSMVGTSSDVIFGDAAQRGIEFDWEGAMQSALRNAAVASTSEVVGRKQIETSIFRGYTSTSQGEGFSWSMEGYINDYGISQLAAALIEKGEDYSDEMAYYRNRAQNYVNLYNADLGWFMGKNDSGSFRETDPEKYNPQSWWGDYTETNGYNMAFTVPQDGQGLANLYGGRDKLAEKLDGLFETQCTNTRTSPSTIHEELEAREVKMGLYGHSNQPSHHIPYMYNYAGQPWKTQEKVREVLDRLYIGSEIGQGYCGDEDNGEMSAWYVLSALGIYPVSMGNPEFAIGSPLFTKATIHLENGEDLVISAPKNSRENIYVQSVKLNGQAYDKNYILHSDLAAGGTLEFEMGAEPSTWGSSEESLPVSITKGDEAPAPEKDAVAANVSTATRPNYSSKEDQFASRDIPAGDLRALIDNTSATSAIISNNEASIYFTSPAMYKMSMVTVTSGSNAENAPNHAALYGSNDGKSWELLSEKDLSFNWAQYTRPLTVAEEKVAPYKTYRLDLTSAGSSMQLAEVEFMGKSAITTDRAELDKALLTYNSLKPKENLYTAESWAVLEAAVEAAGKLGIEATQEQVDTAAQDIQNAIEKLELNLVPGDMDGNGEVTIQDVMEACKVLARQSAGKAPTEDEMARGDLNGDNAITITDVMEICKILARKA